MATRPFLTLPSTRAQPLDASSYPEQSNIGDLFDYAVDTQQQRQPSNRRSTGMPHMRSPVSATDPFATYPVRPLTPPFPYQLPYPVPSFPGVPPNTLPQRPVTPPQSAPHAWRAYPPQILVQLITLPTLLECTQHLPMDRRHWDLLETHAATGRLTVLRYLLFNCLRHEDPAHLQGRTRNAVQDLGRYLHTLLRQKARTLLSNPEVLTLLEDNAAAVAHLDGRGLQRLCDQLRASAEVDALGARLGQASLLPSTTAGPLLGAPQPAVTLPPDNVYLGDLTIEQLMQYGLLNPSNQ